MRRTVGLVVGLFLLGASPAAAADPIVVEDLIGLLPSATSALAGAGFNTSLLETVTLEVVDLDDRRIGEAVGTIVRFDPTAAGVGWYVDPTPWLAEEFGPNRMGMARALSSPATERVDLWSTLVHELGHVVGLDHDDGGFMTATLVRGERWSPAVWDVGERID